MAATRERTLQDRFQVVIASTAFQPLKTYAIPDNTVVRLEVTLTSRQGGGNRAIFRRTALLFKQGGSVQIQGPTWLTDQTVKSAPTIDVGFDLGASSITLKAKNAVASNMTWLGEVSMVRVN